MARTLLTAIAATLALSSAVGAQTCPERDPFDTLADIALLPEPYLVLYGALTPNAEDTSGKTVLFTGQDLGDITTDETFSMPLQCLAETCPDAPIKDAILYAALDADNVAGIDTSACSAYVHADISEETLASMRSEMRGIMGADG